MMRQVIGPGAGDLRVMGIRTVRTVKVIGLGMGNEMRRAVTSLSRSLSLPSHSLTHSLSSHTSVSGRSRISMALLCVTMVVPKYDKIS